MNSHVQITKGLMKGFAFKTDDGLKVKCLDLKTNIISEEKIKELGATKDYYPNIIEYELNRSVEAPFGHICAKIRKFSKDETSNISFTKDEESTIILFLNYSLLRSNKSLETTQGQLQHGTYSQFINNFQHHHQFGLENCNSKLIQFRDRKVSFIINKTERNFVIPKNCFYTVPLTNDYQEYILVLPVSPKLAIVLLSEAQFRTIVTDKKKYYREILQDDVNFSFNKYALRTEKTVDNSFIISRAEKELIFLQRNNNIKYELK